MPKSVNNFLAPKRSWDIIGGHLMRFILVATCIFCLDINPALAQRIDPADLIRGVIGLGLEAGRQARQREVQQHPPQQAPQQTSRMGSILSRSDVRDLQMELSSMGYDVGVADGLMGPRTRNALAAFQRAQGLPVTSEIDEKTIAALAAAREQGSAPQAAARETISILGADFPVPLDDGRLAEIPAEWEEVKPYIPEWLLAKP
ncbi:MAG: peptidoglycan-binding domain-containing protein, partial [Oricola sp.]